MKQAEGRPSSARSTAAAGESRLNRRQLLALTAIIVLLGILLSLLLARTGGFSVPSYGLGDIARTDVLIPRDALIEDREAMAARKAEARSRTLPVYRFDPAPEGERLARIARFFTAARKALGLPAEGTAPPRGRRTYRGLPAGTRGELQAAARTLGLAPPLDDLLDFLVREAFGAALESRIATLARSASPPLVVADGGPFDSRKTAILKFDPRSGREETIPPGQLLSLAQARSRIAETIARDSGIPAPWKPHLQRILQVTAVPSLRFDDALTRARQEREAGNVDHVLRRLKRGKVVLRQGDEVGPDHLVQLEAIRRLSPVRSSLPQHLGTAALTVLWLALLAVLLRSLTPATWRYGKFLGFCLLTLTVNLLLLKLSWFTGESLSQSLLAFPLNEKALFLFALPFAFGSMLITLLAGVQSALLFTVAFSPMAGQAVGADAYGFSYLLFVNLTGILLIRRAAQHIGIVAAGFKLGLAAAVAFLLLQLAQQASLEPLRIGVGAGLALLSGLLNALFLLFLLPLCERLFQVTTEFRLAELGNLNLPLVQEMIRSAPGTYNHSIAVGTLCEGAAKAVGLNPLFLRIASLYHDIGKTLQPDHFIENQHGENPHDRLTPLESLQILKGHVTGGLQLAARAKLPPSLTEMIPQHHGTKRIRFFEERAYQQDPEGARAMPPETFRYPGPRPQTRAACILMLADQIEAAARTLECHAPERLAELIHRIIVETTEDGQFSESDLTLADLERIAGSYLETLVSFYHGRIAYPECDSTGKPPSGPGEAETGRDGDARGNESGQPRGEKRRKRFFRPRAAAVKGQGRLFN